MRFTEGHEGPEEWLLENDGGGRFVLLEGAFQDRVLHGADAQADALGATKIAARCRAILTEEQAMAENGDWPRIYAERGPDLLLAESNNSVAPSRIARELLDSSPE